MAKLTSLSRRVVVDAGAVGHRLSLGVVSILLLLLILAPTAPPASAQSCTFVLGFRALRDMIPNIVGECLTDEHHNPENGDALQETTRGLLVWRKADNFTAFTDGYRTWVVGPFGLQTRLNTERFPWEADQAAPADSSCVSLPTSRVRGGEVDVVDWRVEPRDRAGGWTVVGRVRNNCAGPRAISLNATLFDGEGRPVGVTTSEYLRLGPREVGGFRLATGPLPGAAVRAMFRSLSLEPPKTEAIECLGLGTTRCLRTEALLTNAVRELRQIERGEWLLRVAAEHGITLRRANLPSGTLGQYVRRSQTVWVDTELDAYSDWERATVLAHELQHAHDDVADRLLPGTEGCLRNEEDGFRRSAEIWSQLWQGRLPEPQNRLQEELNAIVLAIESDPAGFVAELTRIYQRECSVE